MAVQRHLSRAPAKEALIDIQFEPRVPIDGVDKFVAKVAPEFKRKIDLWEAFIGFNTGGDGKNAKTQQTVVGRRLDSDDPPHVLQCRVGGFTFSRLSPYGKWEDLRREAYRWWRDFQAVVQPQRVTRIAVRYINAIKLPLPINDFADYFTCPPKVPEALPQAISGFLVRIVIPDDANNCISIVTQALEDRPSVGDDGASITVLLDVDVFRTTRIESSQMEEVWSGLDALREQKNRMFFEHLTEKTVEMFI
jgi:uncharacterized protein (TIGR04255 family)